MLDKLTIQRCDVDASSQQVIPRSGAANMFVALVNPAEVKHSHGIDYREMQEGDTAPLGTTTDKQTYANHRPETVSFSLVLDGTGAVPLPAGGVPPDVRKLIDQLKHVCYDYDG